MEHAGVDIRPQGKLHQISGRQSNCADRGTGAPPVREAFRSRKPLPPEGHAQAEASQRDPRPILTSQRISAAVIGLYFASCGHVCAVDASPRGGAPSLSDTPRAYEPPSQDSLGGVGLESTLCAIACIRQLSAVQGS